MTPKEHLREKFVTIINRGAYFGEPKRIKWSEQIADHLMAAVDEIMGKPLHITIKPSDEQLEKIRKDFQSAAFQIWAYGDPSVPHVPSYGDNT